MNRPFNPEMLNLARDLLGMSQMDLARMTGINHADISRYESGLVPVPDEELAMLATALDLPVTFFYRPGYRHGVESGEVFHRKRASTKAAVLKRIYATLDLFRLNLEVLLQRIDVEFSYRIPEYNVRTLRDTIENIAGAVRAYWRMPPGHVRDLIAVLESASFMIYVLDFGSDDIDEVTQWVEPLPPIMLINSRAPGDRLRFSVAHALGHLIMHHGVPPYPDMEKEADQFAAAFLMPAKDIKPEFSKVTLEQMLGLKPLWKVSIQALINRARDLGKISDTRHTTLYQALSRKGWRKDEPFPLEPERPTLFSKLLSLYVDEQRYTLEEISQLLSVYERRFRYWYFSGQAQDQPYIRLLPRKD